MNRELDNSVVLNDIVIFQNGKGHESLVDENGKYILINSKFISTDGEVKKYCMEQLTPLYKNDIAMVMSDLPNGKALAKCYLVEEDNKYTLNQRICSLRVKDGFDPYYIYYKINRNSSYLKFDDGVNQTNLKKDDVLNLAIDIPLINKQKEYSNILLKLDNKILKENNKLYKLNKLKKGLMQNMFV